MDGSPVAIQTDASKLMLCVNWLIGGRPIVKVLIGNGWLNKPYTDTKVLETTSFKDRCETESIYKSYTLTPVL